MSKYNGLTRQSTLEDREFVYRGRVERIYDTVENGHIELLDTHVIAFLRDLMHFGRILPHDDRYDKNFNKLLELSIRGGNLNRVFTIFSPKSNFNPKNYSAELSNNIFDAFDYFLVNQPSTRDRQTQAHFQSIVENISIFARLLQHYNLAHKLPRKEIIQIFQKNFIDYNMWTFYSLIWFAVTQESKDFQELNEALIKTIIEVGGVEEIMNTEEANKFLSQNNYDILHKYFKNKHTITSSMYAHLPSSYRLGIIL